MRRSSCGCGRILASASRFVTAIKKSALRPIQAVHGRSRCPRCGPAALANPDHMTEERRLPLGIPRWESNSVDQDGDDWDAEAGPGPFVSNRLRARAILWPHGRSPRQRIMGAEELEELGAAKVLGVGLS